MNKNLPLPNKQDLPLVLLAYDYRQWREKFILTILQLAAILGVVLIAFSWSTSTVGERILYVGLYLILFGVTALPVSYSIRAYVFLGLIFIVGVNSLLVWGPWIDTSIFFLTFITMSALLFDNRTDIAAVILSVAVFAIVGIAEQAGIYHLRTASTLVAHTNASDWLGYIVDFSVFSIIILVAVTQFKREFVNITEKMRGAFEEVNKERAHLEERVKERTEELETRTSQLRSSTIVARTIAEIRNINELMDAITGLTSEQFGYYHIGLYLLDENKKTAFLQASSSETGKRLIGQGFHIEPSKKDPFFPVVEQIRYHISTDTDVYSFVQDPNFPLTRSRMSLPLATRGAVMGILDIHSEQTRAFNAQDAETMQTLADLAAISIDNVRLISETKNLVSQLESNMSFQARNTWSQLTSRHTPAYQYTPAGVRPIFSPKKITPEDAEGLNIPLSLHGQKIGVIKLKRKGVAASWSERERNLVEKIADQVSLALENSRLVDEAQKNALRDQMIANISSRVRETLDIESVIRTATTELRKVFDLKEAEISVGFPQSDRKQTSALRLK